MCSELDVRDPELAAQLQQDSAPPTPTPECWEGTLIPLLEPCRAQSQAWLVGGGGA